MIRLALLSLSFAALGVSAAQAWAVPTPDRAVETGGVPAPPHADDSQDGAETILAQRRAVPGAPATRMARVVEALPAVRRDAPRTRPPRA